MGKTFVGRVLTGKLGTPKKVIVFSRDEAKQHEMRMEYLHRAVSTDEVIFNNFKNVLEFRIGDVRDYADVCSAVRDADIVVNGAALKQVPTCEYNPMEAVLTNVMGTRNVIEAALDRDVGRVLALSTDKAVNPVNLYGATKLVAEKLVIQGNAYRGRGSTRERRVARYSPLASKSPELALASLSDAELVALLGRSQPAWTAPETGYRA